MQVSLRFFSALRMLRTVCLYVSVSERFVYVLALCALLCAHRAHASPLAQRTMYDRLFAAAKRRFDSLIACGPDSVRQYYITIMSILLHLRRACSGSEISDAGACLLAGLVRVLVCVLTVCMHHSYRIL